KRRPNAVSKPNLSGGLGTERPRGRDDDPPDVPRPGRPPLDQGEVLPGPRRRSLDEELALDGSEHNTAADAPAPAADRNPTARTTPGGGSSTERLPDLRQVVPAVSQRMVLDHELRGHRSAVGKRERRGAVELLLREAPHGVRRLPAVLAQERERLGSRDRP